MPPLTRAFIRAALAWLFLALSARFVAVLLPLPGSVLAVLLGPAPLHALVVGWLTQLIFGVAWWMFPRLPKDRRPDPAGLGWTVFLTLNAGLVLRCVGEPAGVLPLLRVSAFLQLVAALGFAASAWRRIGAR